jgi:hypothetical protein
MADLPVNITAKRAASYASISDRNPTHVPFLALLCLVKREADHQVATHSSTFHACPALGLGVTPIFRAIANQMLRATANAISLRATLVPVRFKLELNGAAPASAQTRFIDGVTLGPIFLQVPLNVGGF